MLPGTTTIPIMAGILLVTAMYLSPLWLLRSGRNKVLDSWDRTCATVCKAVVLKLSSSDCKLGAILAANDFAKLRWSIDAIAILSRNNSNQVVPGRPVVLMCSLRDEVHLHRNKS